MSLTLTIVNAAKLENGESTTVTLDRHGLTIGRSAHVDWSLPDPNNHISSTHCEIRFKDGAYNLVDTSTNGTFVNGAEERLKAPHRIADGDLLQIGHYDIRTRLGPARAAPPPPPPAPAEPEGAFNWGVAPAPPPPASAWDSPQAAAPPANPPAGDSWGAPPQAAPSPGGWSPPPEAPATDGWGTAPAAAASGGWGPAPAPTPSAPSVGGWEAPAAKPSETDGWGAAAASAASPWDPPAAAAAPGASEWSDAGPAGKASLADDIWGSLAASNSVDWGRGFDPTPVSADFHFAAPAMERPAAPGPAPARPAPAPAPSPVGDTAFTAFLRQAGLGGGDLKSDPAQALGAAGTIFRRLVGGLIVLLEARARAKAQMGVQGTLLEFNGNNPLKFARTPEQAVAQLVNPPERGFMSAEQAVEDAFRDLQAHQMATLAAMQGALAATLKRFSPDSIRGRAEMRGVLAKILPSARDAALWQAYEREFEGVAKGSDEAFMDVFAKEFRTAYETAAAGMKSRP